MAKTFAVASFTNDMAFLVTVDEADYEKAKEICAEGFARWFNVEEYPEYHDVGYAEPSMWMMDEAGIKYEIDDYPEEGFDGEIVE